MSLAIVGSVTLSSGLSEQSRVLIPSALKLRDPVRLLLLQCNVPRLVQPDMSRVVSWFPEQLSDTKAGSERLRLVRF